MSTDKPARPAPAGLPPQIVFSPPASLKPNPRNARVHSRRQIGKIANSIRAVGHLVPIVADENGIVLEGHATLAAAKLLNVQAVPTLSVSGLSEAQKRAFMIADNRVAEDAGWDRREILSVEFGELAELLRPVDLDLTVTGFETSEIDLIFPDRGAAKPDPADAVPLIPKDVVTHPGKLWCLGDHRLIFGDARSAADLDKLMAGACARLVFTDPPDNVPIAGHVQGRGCTKHREFAYAVREMSDDQFAEFLIT